MHRHKNIPTSFAEIVKTKDFFGEITYTYYVCDKDGKRYHGPLQRRKEEFQNIYICKWLDSILYKVLNKC